MSFFVAILYTAVLSVLFEHSFRIERINPPHHAVAVTLYINRHTWFLSISTLLLFIIDWASFHYLFVRDDKATFDFLHNWLVLLYFPAVLLLSLAVIFSYDNSQGNNQIAPCFFLCLGLYHLVAAFADVAWIIAKIALKAPQMDVELVVVLFSYLILRCTIAGCYLYGNRVNPRLPALPGLALKPGFLYALYYNGALHTLSQG